MFLPPLYMYMLTSIHATSVRDTKNTWLPIGMVVIVSGFVLQTDVLRQLFNLFSFYGVVKRIKVMFKKVGTVMLIPNAK